MKQRRTLILFGIILIVMVVLVLLQNRQPPPDLLTVEQATQAALSEGELLFTPGSMIVLEMLAIRLQIPSTEQSLLLSRDSSGQWTAPDLDGQLDASVATQIAQTFVLMLYERTLPLDENASLESYGFPSQPRFIAQVLFVDETQHIIAVGGLTPTEDSYYVLVDERADLYVVPRAPVDFLINYTLNPPVVLTTLTPRATLSSSGG